MVKKLIKLNFPSTQACTRFICASMFVFIIAAMLLPLISTTCGGGMEIHMGSNGPMCYDHEMTGSQDHQNTTVSAVMFQETSIRQFLLIVIVATYLVLSVLKKPTNKLAPNILYRIKYLRWIWSRSRPFTSSKNFIPFFTPVRDV